MVKFLYDFGKRNPLEGAIERIGAALEALKADLDQLKVRVGQLAVEVARNENRILVEVLREQVIELSRIAFDLRSRPTDREQAAVGAFEAGARADDFISAADRWQWRDIRAGTPRDAEGNPTGPATEEALAADFKIAAAFPVYTLALAAGNQGVLHGVYPNGQMLTYRHLDWDTGGPRFEGPLAASNTWRDQLRLFPPVGG